MLLSSAHYQAALVRLSLFHVAIIAASNYLVQLPINLFGLHTTWGAFTFPFIFLATDLTVRIFGAELARRIIGVVMMPALLVSYLLGVLFFEGQYQGAGQLAEFNLFVAICSARSWMCRYSTVCASCAGGGLLPWPRPWLATCSIPWLSSRSPSGAARMPSWRSTGSRLPAWTMG